MADTPTWTYEILYYINTAAASASSPTWTLVDFDNSFNPARDNTTYDAAYKARKNQPSWVVSSKTTVEVDIDIVDDATLQEWFKTHEDDFNTEVEILRVWKTGTSPYDAKKAAFVWNGNPIDGEASAPARVTGTMSMIDDGWTLGTATYDSQLGQSHLLLRFNFFEPPAWEALFSYLGGNYGFRV